MSIFITSDLHLGHTAIIEHCHRPFTNVHEMNCAITERWNKMVKPKDEIYVIGDFCLSNPKHYQDKLNGRKILIRGNHDRHNNYHLIFEAVHDYFELNINKKKIVLCHYPFESWRGSGHGSLHLHGHCHGKLVKRFHRKDVGVDINNFYPYPLEDLIETLEQETRE